MNVGIGGEFHLRVVNSETGEVTKERKFKNLIVNSGLIHWAKGNPQGGGLTCCVGTGNQTPAITDTALYSQVACVDFPIGVVGTVPEAPTYRVSKKHTTRFNAGSISTTITEIGVRYTVSQILLCRQLILDDQGNVSALTVLPNEYLDVVYILWYYPALNDIPFTFVMDGVTYSCVSRLADATRAHVGSGNEVIGSTTVFVRDCYATQTLGDITAKPQGVSVGGGGISSTRLPYDDSKPYSWATSYKFTLAQGNTGSGIGSMYIEDFYGIFARQISFSPALPKDANTEMTLVFTDTIGRYSGTP